MTLTQVQREMLVGALLDITYGDFHEGIKTLDEEVVDKLEELNYADSLAALHNALEDSGNPNSQQIYLQTIALMSDDCLTLIVTAFGTNPLEGS